jgi:hypothetical protein
MDSASRCACLRKLLETQSLTHRLPGPPVSVSTKTKDHFNTSQYLGRYSYTHWIKGNGQQMAPSFQHYPLNQADLSIRLLNVLPGSPSDIIRCEIQNATIDALYTCLSYVWCFPDRPHKKILVNNAEFWVRSNL